MKKGKTMVNKKMYQKRVQWGTLKKYPDILDIKQMCAILGISQKTSYGLLQNKKIKCLKVGRSYRIPKRFLLDYLGINTETKM